MKESADDNFKFDENSRKFSKRVENTVGKGEITCYEQFLLFPQCFQKASFLGASKGVIVWEWVKCVYIHTDVLYIYFIKQAIIDSPCVVEAAVIGVSDPLKGQVPLGLCVPKTSM